MAPTPQVLRAFGAPEVLVDVRLNTTYSELAATAIGFEPARGLGLVAVISSDSVLASFPWGRPRSWGDLAMVAKLPEPDARLEFIRARTVRGQSARVRAEWDERVRRAVEILGPGLIRCDSIVDPIDASSRYRLSASVFTVGKQHGDTGTASIVAEIYVPLARDREHPGERISTTHVLLWPSRLMRVGPHENPIRVPCRGAR